MSNTSVPSFPFDLAAPRLTIEKTAAKARVDVATVWRWILSGVCGGIKLRSVKVGARRFVLESDLAAFLTALNAPKPEPVPPADTALAHTRRQQKAEEEADRRGL
jgi:hypothetical protein